MENKDPVCTFDWFPGWIKIGHNRVWLPLLNSSAVDDLCLVFKDSISITPFNHLVFSKSIGQNGEHKPANTAWENFTTVFECLQKWLLPLTEDVYNTRITKIKWSNRYSLITNPVWALREALKVTQRREGDPFSPWCSSWRWLLRLGIWVLWHLSHDWNCFNMWKYIMCSCLWWYGHISHGEEWSWAIFMNQISLLLLKFSNIADTVAAPVPPCPLSLYLLQALLWAVSQEFVPYQVPELPSFPPWWLAW